MTRDSSSPTLGLNAPIIISDAGRPGTTRSSSDFVIGSSKPIRNSNNPYRQPLKVQTSSQSLTQEAEQTGGRKFAPTRAVFDDLRTAHSSITSGSARNGLRNTFHNSTSELQDESIPLEDMEPGDHSVLLDLPLPPLPAAHVINRQGTSLDLEQGLPAMEPLPLSKQLSNLRPSPQPTGPAQGGSFFASIKNAFASISSPLIRDGKSEVQFPAAQWPEDSLGIGTTTRRSSLNIDKHFSRPRANTLSPPDAHLSGVLGRSRTVTGGTRYFTPLEKASSDYGVAQSGSLTLTHGGSEIGHNNQNPAAKTNDLFHVQDDFYLPDIESPTGAHQTQGLPRQFSNSSSLPEGSTVGNIYKHYVRSDGFDDISEDEGSDAALSSHPGSPGYFTRYGSRNAFPSSPPVRLSALDARKKQRIQRSSSAPQSQPPEFTLPVPPYSSAVQHVTPLTPQGLPYSSSYGDSKKLLGITQPSSSVNLSRSDDRSYPKTDYALSEVEESSEPSLPALNSKNPFRTGQDPNIIVYSPDTDSAVAPCDDPRIRFSVTDRLPLEREVSNALRRASGYTTYSNGSISTTAPERYEDFPSETLTYKAIRSLITKNEAKAPPLPPESANHGRRVVPAQAQNFYDQQAIPSNWVHSQQHIRVPINHNGSFPVSPPDSPPARVKTPRENRRPSEDADNDWETVGDSIAIGAYESDMLGGTVNRAGSSLANTSDPGSASPYVAELNEFSSTDRIAQHPGNIQYSGGYRQRDLKKTRIPIFLPVFREHKINGYLSDSNRVRPQPNPYYATPTPLRGSHTNPFKSAPPEVKPAVRAIASSSSSHLRSRNGSRFPILSVITQSSDGDNAEIHTTPATNTASKDPRSSEWMDDYGDPGKNLKNLFRTYISCRLVLPDINYFEDIILKNWLTGFIGPVINPQDDPFLETSSAGRPSSWQHVMTFGRGDSVPGYNADGSRIKTDNHEALTRSRSSRYLDSSSIIEWQEAGQKDGFVETRTYGGRDLTHARDRDRKPLVKGPPGAFYQGLRASLSPKKGRGRAVARAPSGRRSSVKDDYPTNTLRPISLVEAHRPVTPTEQPTPDTNERLENDFIYRSPLAPPKRDTWQQLYNPVQLKNFQERAKSDGLLGSRKSIGVGIRNSIMGISAKRHLFEAPRLATRYQEDDPARTDLAERKRRVSTCILALSSVFPPMLVLYAVGYLDGVMTWWTDGECSAVGSKHKKVAQFLLYMWGMAVFFGLVSFLVYWFGFRPRES